MKRYYSQKGSAHLGILIVVGVAAVVALAAYEVVKTNNAVAPPASTNVTTATSSVPAITNTASLNSVENILNNTNLNQGLDPANYNQDVSTLL